MVTRVKPEKPIKPLRNVNQYSNWQVPSLSLGDAPSYFQPSEEEDKISEEEVLEPQITEEELQAIRDEAYQEGLELGKAEGLKLAQDKIYLQLSALGNLIEQLQEPLKVCSEEVEQQIVELAFAIARQIIRRELKQDPTQIIATIREALKLLPVASQSISIALHPEDAAIVSEALSSSDDTEQSDWKIKSDPSVEKGGCHVATNNSNIDASIDKQIAVIYSRIVGGQRASDHDGG